MINSVDPVLNAPVTLSTHQESQKPPKGGGGFLATGNPLAYVPGKSSVTELSVRTMRVPIMVTV